MVTAPTVSDQVWTHRRWKTLSRAYRRAHPLCQACEARLASEVHHIQPIALAPHRAYDWANLRALCPACHKAQHATRGPL